MNYDDSIQLQSTTTGMTITQSTSKQIPLKCKAWKENKITKLSKSLHEYTTHAKQPLELIHMDICSPVTPTSREGYKYIINCIDEH